MVRRRRRLRRDSVELKVHLHGNRVALTACRPGRAAGPLSRPSTRAASAESTAAAAAAASGCGGGRGGPACGGPACEAWPGGGWGPPQMAGEEQEAAKSSASPSAPCGLSTIAARSAAAVCTARRRHSGRGVPGLRRGREGRCEHSEPAHAELLGARGEQRAGSALSPAAQVVQVIAALARLRWRRRRADGCHRTPARGLLARSPQAARYGEVWGGMGRYGEVWGGRGR